MANGKLTLEEFKELDQATRDYHIWSKLEILDCLGDKFAGKWVERTITWVGIILGGAFLAAIANVVLAMK